MTELPKVSIVIVNLNGKHLLVDCFESIKKLNYPKDKVEVVVVDNGSKDGSCEFIREKYSSVKLITNETNEGFAKPSNDGAKAATGEYVAFLNNDMRVHKNWLKELIESLRRNNTECAGSLILDWSGKLLDFAGGGFSFQGYAYQNDFKRPIKELEPTLKDDKEILFACGGAMIVKRELFLFAGGFDEDFFAYYEDVDLGWRLHILGCNTVLSVKSRVDHKHNSTSKSMTKARVQYLFERNKLYTCYKNYGEEYFTKTFLPSVLLDVREAVLQSGIDPENYDLKNPCPYDDSPVRFKEFSAMKLAAINEFVKNIGKMAPKRRFIQENRKEKDEDLIKFMTDPFRVFPKDTGELLSSEFDLIKAFDIDKVFKKDFRKNALIVLSKDSKFETYKNIAEMLLKTDRFELTVASQSETRYDGAETLIYSPSNIQKLSETIKKSSVVIMPAALFEEIDSMKYLLVDQYVAIDMNDVDLKVSKDKEIPKNLRILLEKGDYFIIDDKNKYELLELLRRVGKNNAVHPEKGLEGIVGAGKSLFVFALSPYHCNIVEQDDLEDASTPMVEIPATSSDGEGVALNTNAQRQLNELRAQQIEIQKMIRLNSRRLKETSEEITALSDYSKLMNARFLKLKSALSKIKFLRRFLG